jgi:hypothetical protein
MIPAAKQNRDQSQPEDEVKIVRFRKQHGNKNTFQCSSHSDLSATSGSTRVARRAGM